MKLLTTSAMIAHAFDTQLSACRRLTLAVAWASAGFPQYDALKKAGRKLRRVVIGTHFYQTDPEVIKRFSLDARVKFVTSTGEVFHPKVFVFEHPDGSWASIVGSANFTRGGFIKNHEICVLITSADDPTGTLASEAKAAIDGFWKKAVSGSSIDLTAYRTMHRRFARRIGQAAGDFGSNKPGHALHDIDLLKMSWKQFQAKVSENAGLAERLKVLSAARPLFSQDRSFAQLPLVKRQGIAGFRNEPDVPWGWFGSMTSAGSFKNVVNNRSPALSRALAQIPTGRPVTREDYLRYIGRFVRSFPERDDRHERHGLGTATRLLAIKRPDVFVCLDSANSAGLFHAFGVKISRQDYEGYWDQIIERLQLAKWWNSPRPPNGVGGLIWDGRAALLDAIYYVPKE